MFKANSKKSLAIALSLSLLLLAIPVGMIGFASNAASGTILDVNYNDTNSLTVGSPVNNNVAATKDGGTGVKSATVSQTGNGSLTYNFTDLTAVGKASVYLTGRAILGASVTVKVKVNESDAWTTVKKFGGSVEWDFHKSAVFDFFGCFRQ